MKPEDLARLFHDAYERLAPSHGYETRKASAVPWADVPAANKSLMIAVAAEVAPTITATALRDAANDWQQLGTPVQQSPITRWLRTRADQLDGGQADEETIDVGTYLDPDATETVTITPPDADEDFAPATVHQQILDAVHSVVPGPGGSFVTAAVWEPVAAALITYRDEAREQRHRAEQADERERAILDALAEVEEQREEQRERAVQAEAKVAALMDERGRTPAAVAEVDDDEEVLATVDDVRVGWWRTVPCSPTFCDEGPHRIHYIPTRERTRGGFQAAALPVAIRDVEPADRIRNHPKETR